MEAVTAAELAILQNPNTIPVIAVLLLAKVKEPLVEIFPAVVVAFPLTHTSPLAEILVEEALPKVVKPTAVKVPNVAKLPLVVRGGGKTVNP